MEFANTVRKGKGDTNVLKHLVVDSGAIIKAERLEHVAENYWTVQEVIDEIRDSKSKHVLNTLPYELKIRVPSAECMNAVIKFSKKTGDFRGLSVPDLKVLALTYMFEKEEVGVDHLRTKPMSIEDMKNAMAKKKKNVSVAPNSQEDFGDQSINAELKSPDQSVLAKPEEAEDIGTATSASDLTVTSADCDLKGKEKKVSDSDIAQVQNNLSNMNNISVAVADRKPSVATNDQSNSASAKSSKNTLEVSPVVAKKPYSSKILNAHKTNVISSVIENGDFDDSDDVGWVGPENIDQMDDSGWGVVHRRGRRGRNGSKHHNGNLSNSNGNESVLKREVGCVTVDFAMQNVLMQMGLGLYSIRGVAIRKLKQWVLRCLACYHISSKMDKLFCPRCGSATMTKLSVFISDQGGVRYGFKKNYKVKTRGTRFGIAKTKGGRKDQGLLLREDQLLTGQWKMAARKKEKMESMFGEDLSEQLGLKEYQNADLVVGFGRRNPNAQRGRERRGKKKKNKNARFF